MIQILVESWINKSAEAHGMVAELIKYGGKPMDMYLLTGGGSYS